MDLAKESTTATGTSEEPDELVGRGIPSGLGLLTAVIVYCTAFGGPFGLAFAVAYNFNAHWLPDQDSNLDLPG